jgi:hypothetical protein
MWRVEPGANIFQRFVWYGMAIHKDRRQNSCVPCPIRGLQGVSGPKQTELIILGKAGRQFSNYKSRDHWTRRGITPSPFGNTRIMCNPLTDDRRSPVHPVSRFRSRYACGDCAKKVMARYDRRLIEQIIHERILGERTCISSQIRSLRKRKVIGAPEWHAKTTDAVRASSAKR